MPSPQTKNERRVAFLADRMAILMVDLVRRDHDYGPFCFDDFYEGKKGEEMRKSRYYQTSLDFVRNMLRRQDNETANAE